MTIGTTVDPLHTQVPDDTTWTTVNVSEAMPGVLSPLTWTFWMPAIERGSRRSYHALGIFPKALTELPAEPGRRFQAVFFGRAALNPDLARLLGDLAPGTNGAATEERVLGFARDLPSRSTNRRLPAIAAKMPRQIRTIDRQVRAVLVSTREWWTASVAREPATLADSVALLREARDRFEAVIEVHTTATCIGLLFAESLERLVGERVSAEAIDRATTGLGDLEELALVRDLEACSTGALTIDEVLARHGFHGPDEGQLQSRSWRQDPTPLEPLLERYRSVTTSPGRTGSRDLAEAELIGALPPARRPLGRFLLGRATRALPLREVGKTAFLMAIDVGRHAATAAGRQLAELGAIEGPDDVYFLTLDELTELTEHRASGVAEMVAERRARQATYERLELPAMWSGMPEPVERPLEPVSRAGTVLHGACGAPGAVEATLFVARDLTEAFSVEPGCIVVCPSTDPSWAAVFPVIEGIVVEVGSHTSHAAIVARELGLPCLVGVPRATELLASGMRARLDADAGRITVLDEGAP